MKNKEENPIHLRFGNIEAKNAKKELLSSEVSILKMRQIIQEYKKIRIKEFEKKEKISSKLKSLKTEINKLQKTLPKLKLPKELEKERKTKNKDYLEMAKYGTVEEQLRQIQNKLKQLEEN